MYLHRLIRYAMFSGVLVILLLACGAREEGIRPRRTTLTEAVYASAVVVPREYYMVYAAVPGIISRSSLQEGKSVNRGEVLVEIEAEQASLEQHRALLELEQARENIEGQQAVLHEMALRIHSAKLQVVADSTHYARQSRLWKQNIGSRQSYEMTALQLTTSRNALKELQRAYARTRAELNDRLALAQATFEQRRAITADHLVRAAHHGTVYEVLREVGESVNSQTPIARIASTGDFIIRLSIDESDIVRVAPGQEVIVSLDAYPGKTFTAEILRVLSHKDEPTQSYIAEAVFRHPPDRLFERLTGEANVIIARRAHVLTLPTPFVGSNNTVLTEQGVVEVVTGATDFRHTEIVSGIDTTTIVYQSP